MSQKLKTAEKSAVLQFEKEVIALLGHNFEKRLIFGHSRKAPEFRGVLKIQHSGIFPKQQSYAINLCRVMS